MSGIILVSDLHVQKYDFKATLFRYMQKTFTNKVCALNDIGLHALNKTNFPRLLYHFIKNEA